jgi:hypothetical protein
MCWLLVLLPPGGSSAGRKPMSGERVFFDTNMLVYLYSKDEPQKQRRALSALLSNDCVVRREIQGLPLFLYAGTMGGNDG